MVAFHIEVHTMALTGTLINIRRKASANIQLMYRV